jgi:hypothetical protein
LVEILGFTIPIAVLTTVFSGWIYSVIENLNSAGHGNYRFNPSGVVQNQPLWV